MTHKQICQSKQVVTQSHRTWGKKPGRYEIE
jgi:hypothetical protein